MRKGAGVKFHLVSLPSEITFIHVTKVFYTGALWVVLADTNAKMKKKMGKNLKHTLQPGRPAGKIKAD